MDKLIPVINKLHDVVAVVESSPLDLPQIVVVGEQSSGKSSVLESLVGRDFLPRGTGIVTRRPLTLQLIMKRAMGSGPSEWGEFLHLPGKKFLDFNDIRKYSSFQLLDTNFGQIPQRLLATNFDICLYYREIVADTERVSGTNKGVSPQPISLKIYSPNVVNLTLVDLPGLTKVPVGDQPRDIAVQIRNMVMEYVTKPNAIILAISPANADIANSDGLRIAREVDPRGDRTIGVLTKVDLMDKGTDCLPIIMGKVYRLKHGFIPVVNRSQHEIISNVGVDKARENETNFFSAHPLYRQVASRSGTTYLGHTLNKILMNHIKNSLPELRTRVSTLLQTSKEELAALGDPRLGVSKGALLLHIINSFVHSYNDTIDGRLSSASATTELYGGARINYIFHDLFGAYINSIDSTGGLTDEEIQVIMANSTGPKASLFIPEEAFEQLAKRQIRILEEPSLRCVDLVYDELQRIVNCIELSELKRFDSLKERIIEVVNTLLRDCRAPAKQMIQNLIAIEIAYINTSHPDFIGGGDAIARILKRRAERQVKNSTNTGMDPSIPSDLQNQYASQVERMRQQAEHERHAVIKKQQQEEKQKQRESEANAKKSSSIFDLFRFGGSSTTSASPPASNTATSTSPNASRGASSTAPGLNLGMGTVPTTVRVKSKKERNAEEDFQTELIDTLLKSYFKIVRKNIKDRVPKAIMHFLVNHSKEEIQNKLVEELYREDQFEALLAEGEDVATRRDQYQQTIKVCTAAQRILNEVVDFKI